MKLHIISFTQAGFSLSRRIQNLLSASDLSGDFDEVSLSFGGKACDNELFSIYKPLSEWVQSNFQTGNALIFIGAAGIAVRSISPFIKNKALDPAVLVVDEKGNFVIPILSGHIGGANELARKLAALIGASPVITTASDCNNLPAIDEFAAKNSLSINDMKLAKDFAAKMVKISQNEKNLSLPQFTVSVYIKNDILSLIPKCLFLGIGCKKGKSSEELESFVREVLKSHKIDLRSLKSINSIDLKKDEAALLSLSTAFNIPFCTFSADELNKIPQKVSHSDFVSEITGTDNVCERSVFAAGADEILIPKTAKDGMTLALGIKKFEAEILEKMPEELKKCLVQ